MQAEFPPQAPDVEYEQGAATQALGDKVLLHAQVASLVQFNSEV